MEALKVFIGYDPRQPLAYNVLQHSIVRHASKPVAITPLILGQLPLKRRGLTEFTFSRFLVPYLCDFQGKALFLDADMAVTGDIASLFDACDVIGGAVFVMRKQQQFEWASAMLFNCSRCIKLRPEWIEDEDNNPFDLQWAQQVGDMPEEWNHCVGYAPTRTDASLYHYTQGLPCWPETKGLQEDAIWLAERDAMLASVSWEELMGQSVHAKHVLHRFLRKYKYFQHLT